MRGSTGAPTASAGAGAESDRRRGWRGPGALCPGAVSRRPRAQVQLLRDSAERYDPWCAQVAGTVSGTSREPAGEAMPAVPSAEETPDRDGSLEVFLAGVEKRAWRMAQIATGDGSEALDIVQDAMLKMVQKYGGREPSEWAPLFHRVLQSRITDWHRRRSVRARIFTWLGAGEDAAGNPGELAPSPAPGPEAAMAAEQTAARIEAALRRLPLRQQQAFLLRAWEGLDVRQTAAAMACSEGSVKTHYARALRGLRGELEDLA